MGWRNLTFITRSQGRSILCTPMTHQVSRTTFCSGCRRRHTGTVNTHHKNLMVKSSFQAFACRKINSVSKTYSILWHRFLTSSKGRSQDVCSYPVVLIHLNHQLEGKSMMCSTPQFWSILVAKAKDTSAGPQCFPEEEESPVVPQSEWELQRCSLESLSALLRARMEIVFKPKDQN